MDACIPVLNLIDIRRSIPYGIQQVRELLGISCAFDQVVQVCHLTLFVCKFGRYFISNLLFAGHAADLSNLFNGLFDHLHLQELTKENL